MKILTVKQGTKNTILITRESLFLSQFLVSFLVVNLP